MYASLTVQQYWDERAAASREPNATTADVWLRELEIATIVETLDALHLPDGATLLDAGCGDVKTLREMGFPVWSRASSAKGTA